MELSNVEIPNSIGGTAFITAPASQPIGGAPTFIAPFIPPPLNVHRIAIVGFADADRPLIPWDDKTVELWGLNMAHGWMRRWDRLFEMHPRSELERETAMMKRDTDHLGVLAAERVRPIYMLETQPDIPCSVSFPLDQFISYFGQRCAKLLEQPYATSTFAYMLGLAIMSLHDRAARTVTAGVRVNPEILIYGVPLVNGDEYSYQRECASFFAGYALGSGITLTFTPHAAWLEADGLYGYHRAESMELLARIKEGLVADRDRLALDIKELDTQHASIQRLVNTKDGARQQTESMITKITAIMRGAKL